MPTPLRESLPRALVISVAMALLACDPPTDFSRLDGGTAPEVTGVLEGTVLYAGPRPRCDRDEEGRPLSVHGRVVLLLFLADNPPPPTGTATSAENLLLIPAEELFEPLDCGAVGAPLEIITRSAAYTWPEIPLGEGRAIEYQVRGFFDHDESFNPFFSVRRLPTRGDVAGGAFVSAAEDPPRFRRIRFEDSVHRPEGQRLSGVAVTLGAPIVTELPAFERGAATVALSAEAGFPFDPDPVSAEQSLFEQTRFELELLDPSEASWAQTFEAAGLPLDPGPLGPAFYLLGVDANRDGETDLHPVLGANGVPWLHPIVLLRRARTPLEVQVGIPDVLLVGSVRPTQAMDKQTFAPSIEILVPPAALVSLGPCTIPYFAPGNVAETYEASPAECQELPTGNFDINVLAGNAGGRFVDFRAALEMSMPDLEPEVVDALVAQRTDNGFLLEGGTFSSQAWSVPNELGCPDVAYLPPGFAINQIDPDPATTCDDPDTRMQRSQGPEGRFSVHDPDGDNAPDPGDTSDGRGIPSCQMAPSVALGGMPREVEYMPIPEPCCQSVSRFCGLPLCPLRPVAALAGEEGGREVRQLSDPEEDVEEGEDGTLIPRCVPFLPPAACCR